MDEGMSYTSVLPQSIKMAKKNNKTPAESVCLTYQKLVVPMKMRSVYWKGFGFPANDKGEILTRHKIVCLFCQTSIAYNRNTSNLRMHLESKHRTKLMELEANAPPKQKLIKADKRSFHSVLEIDPNVDQDEHVYEGNLPGNLIVQEEASTSSAPRRKSVSGSSRTDQFVVEPSTGLVEIVVPNMGAPEGSSYVDDNNDTPDFVESAITEFLVTDLVSPSVVEGTGFRNLINSLRPGLQYASKAKVEDQLLPQCFTALRDSVIEEISALQHIGLSLEEWKSGSGHDFFTLAIHFLKDCENLESRVLSSFQLPLDTEKWSEIILDILLRWGIDKEKVVASIVASKKSEQLILEFKKSGIKALPCFTFTLQEAVEKCFKLDVIPNILSKCYAMERLLKDTFLFSSGEDNDDDEEEDAEDTTNINSHCPNIWTSTYHLLKKFISKEQEIGELNPTPDNLIVALTSDEWNKVKTIVTILEPFTVILTTISEENVPSISLIRPFLCQMVMSHLKDDDTDSDFTTLLKLTLREELANHYIEDSIDLLIRMTSFLDPRFKSLPFNQDEDTRLVIAEIMQLLQDNMQENDITESPDNGKKPRLSGIGLLLGNMCGPAGNTPKSERAQREIYQYQSEQAASFDISPLQWWSATRAKCPNLCQLAYTFSCVPASLVPSYHIKMNRKSLDYNKRAGIAPEHVDTILFLHSNQKLFSFQDH